MILGCGKIPDLKLNIKPGIYNEDIEVQILNWKEYASILYNKSGKNPNQNMLVASIKQDGTTKYAGEKFKVKMNEKLEIRYITFQRGKKPSKVKTIIYQVLKRCEKPKIEVVNNIVFLNSSKNERIFYSLNNSKFVEGENIQLQYGKQKIKAYTSREGYQDSEIVEKTVEISLAAPLMKVEVGQPTIEIQKDRVILKAENSDEIFYQVTNSLEEKTDNWIQYNNPIELKLGTYSINAYARKKIENKFICSARLTTVFDIVDINYTVQNTSYQYTAPETKETVYEPPKGTLIKTNIAVNSDCLIIYFKNNTYIINGYSLMRVKDKNVTKQIKLDNEVIDYSIDENNIYLLFSNQIVMLDENLNKVSEIAIKEKYDKLDVSRKCIFLANTDKITVIEKGLENTTEIPESLKEKLTRISGIKSGIVVGERKGNYNNIISFFYDFKGKRYYDIQNSKNEYCIGIANSYLYTIVDRNTLNVYDNKKCSISRSFNFDMIINSFVKIGDEVILLGNTRQEDEMVILTISKKTIKYHKEKSITPISVTKNANKYIVSGVSKGNYCQVIINNNLIEN